MPLFHGSHRRWMATTKKQRASRHDMRLLRLSCSSTCGSSVCMTLPQYHHSHIEKLAANLATFTSYHAITNRYNFWSYIAFFVVLWTSWFHVVCFDTRFAFDSVWERACKAVHFCSFAAFALVGYKFAPIAANVQSATPHWVRKVG
jgi:hypothetical protein